MQLYTHTPFPRRPRGPSGKVRGRSGKKSEWRGVLGTRAQEAVAAGIDCFSLILRTQTREVPRDGYLQRSRVECTDERQCSRAGKPSEHEVSLQHYPSQASESISKHNHLPLCLPSVLTWPSRQQPVRECEGGWERS